MCAFVLILLCSVVAASPEGEGAAQVPPVTTAPPISSLSPELKSGIDSFSEKLTSILYKQASPGTNVLLSPINIYGALCLLLFGADGKTREDLTKFLGFPNTNETFQLAHKNFGELLSSMELKRSASDFPMEDGVRPTVVYEDVSIANGVFLQKEFALVSSYADGLKSYYNGAVENVDFSQSPKVATDTINKWISEKTHDLIPKLLEEPVDASVRLFLAATVYFSANWQPGTFKSKRSKPEKFTTEGGEVQVEYMFNEQRVSYYDDKDSFSAISLPYKGQDFATLFVLPKDNVSLSDLVENFPKRHFQKVLQESLFKVVMYKIPHIDIKWKNDLVEPLKALNLTSIFQSVNLSKMVSVNTENLRVSQITHATKMEMDEKGTVASAATGMTISLRSGRVGPVLNFVANKPYLLYIYHKKSSVVMFSGVIRNPSVH